MFAVSFKTVKMPVDFVEDLANKFMFKNHMQKKEL